MLHILRRWPRTYIYITLNTYNCTCVLGGVCKHILIDFDRPMRGFIEISKIHAVFIVCELGFFCCKPASSVAVCWDLCLPLDGVFWPQIPAVLVDLGSVGSPFN